MPDPVPQNDAPPPNEATGAPPTGHDQLADPGPTLIQPPSQVPERRITLEEVLTHDRTREHLHHIAHAEAEQHLAQFQTALVRRLLERNEDDIRYEVRNAPRLGEVQEWVVPSRMFMNYIRFERAENPGSVFIADSNLGNWWGMTEENVIDDPVFQRFVVHIRQRFFREILAGWTTPSVPFPMWGGFGGVVTVNTEDAVTGVRLVDTGVPQFHPLRLDPAPHVHWPDTLPQGELAQTPPRPGANLDPAILNQPVRTDGTYQEVDGVLTFIPNTDVQSVPLERGASSGTSDIIV